VLVTGILLGWLVGVSDWRLSWPATTPSASAAPSALCCPAPTAGQVPGS